MKIKFQIILLLLAILLIATLSIVNMQSVSINFLVGSFQLPLIIVILCSVLLGMMITFLLGLPQTFSLKKQVKEMEKQAKQLSQEKSSSH